MQARFDDLERLVMRLANRDERPTTARRDDSTRRSAGGDDGGGSGGRRDGREGRDVRAGRRDGGGGGANRAGGRPGDWACTECHAFPCFARTSSCFRCQAPRPASAAGGYRAQRGRDSGSIARPTGASSYLGPVGADGARPMVLRRASDAVTTSPTSRAPGASVAARSQAAPAGHDFSDPGRGAQQQQQQGHQQQQRQQHPGVDGFKPVQGRGATAMSYAAAAAAAPPAARPSVATANSWSALAEEEEREQDVAAEMANGVGGAAGQRDVVMQDHQGAEADADAAPGVTLAENDDAGGADLSEAQLKQAWLSHCAAVRLLERDGRAVPAELLAAAKEQREAAERKWRGAKRPHPLHKRLRWAEGELRDAQAKEDSRRNELAEHNAQAAAKAKDIEARLAVDEARTARKRAALQMLQREAAIPLSHQSERAARMAVAGLGGDIAPALSAIIGRLGSDEHGLRGDLQVLATSIQRVENVLREAAEGDLVARQPARFDIGDAADDDDGADPGKGPGDDDGRDSRDAATAGPPAAATVPRWTKPSAGAPWKRVASSVDAVEEARRIVGRMGESSSASSASAAAAANVGDDTVMDPHAITLDPAALALRRGADTNDLAEAERRDRALAELQVLRAHQRQQQQLPQPQCDQQEAERQRRHQAQQDEMHRHQAELEKAAAARAAEDARQREELVARMSPQELARAAELHAQQSAVGAAAFGTQAASQMAGLVHQAHARQVAAAVHSEEDEEEINRLMAMSPEELARHDQEQQLRGLPP